MSSNQYPKNVPSAALIGIVAGVLLGVISENAYAFPLGFFIVGTLSLTILNGMDKD
jgi:hypothetical protein